MLAVFGVAPVDDKVLRESLLSSNGDFEDAVMAAAHANLIPGGWLVCSVEELLPDRDGVMPDGANGNWALQRQGRYAHSLAYLRATAAAARFQVLRLDRETVRYEANAPVAGLLAVLQRVRHDG